MHCQFIPLLFFYSNCSDLQHTILTVAFTPSHPFYNVFKPIASPFNNVFFVNVHPRVFIKPPAEVKKQVQYYDRDAHNHHELVPNFNGRSMHVSGSCYLLRPHITGLFNAQWYPRFRKQLQFFKTSEIKSCTVQLNTSSRMCLHQY